MILLGIDLGTSSVKALALDGQGRTLALGKAEYPVESPQPGWAESDPARWWQATVEAVRSVVAQLAPAEKIEGIGLSGQMHGLVPVDETGQPLRPAMLWADTRATAELEAYRSLPQAARQRLANPPGPGMAGPMLAWVKRHEPAVYRKTRYALQPKDWLRLRLTGQATTDPSDASATLLYDLPADGWAQDVVAALGLNAQMLPEIKPSGEIGGKLSREAAETLGLSAGIPVAVGAGDTPAAALGTGLLEPGRVQLTLGTGAQLIQVYREPLPDETGRTHLYRAAAPGKWYGMAAVQNCGLALDWVRQTLGVSWDEFYASAALVAPGSKGLTFLPYLVHERAHQPHSQQGGAYIGLKTGHRREHLLHAVLEGVALGIKLALEALPAVARAAHLRLAGGGSLHPAWRQMLADILGAELVTVDTANASARGAALLGGIAAGSWPDVKATEAFAPARRAATFPDPAQQPLYEAVYANFLTLSKTISPAK
jgi:xylulokinase